MKTIALFSAVVATTLTACVTAPRVPPPVPTITVPELGLGDASVPRIGDGWWRGYGDPQLDRLMTQALAGNPTLAEALARIREAQASADVAHAGLLPSATYSLQDTRQRFSGHDVIPPPYAGSVRWEGSQGVNLSWDLDFWGRQASLIRQARSRAAATVLDAASARLAVEGAVMQAYVALDRDYALSDLARRTARQRQQILSLTRQRLRAGLDTQVQVHQAAGAVPQAQLELRRAVAARERVVHQLAELTGQGANAYAGIGRPQLGARAALALPRTLPADLLGRRPDVLAAKARVEAATAGKAAAKAAFYPDVNLGLFAGTRAVGFDTLFRAASGSYGFGPAISLPLFDAGRLRARYRGASAGIDDAVAGYNATVLQALRQVADQLTTIESLDGQIADQRQSQADAETAYRLAMQRFRAGLTGYLTVLDTETELLRVHRQHIELISARTSARVSLLLAVGGSFRPPDGRRPTEH